MTKSEPETNRPGLLLRRAHRRSMLEQACLLHVETRTKVGGEIVTVRKLEQRAGYIALKPWVRSHTACQAEARAWFERKKSA